MNMFYFPNKSLPKDTIKPQLFKETLSNHHVPNTGWWFQKWLLFSTIYGMSSFPLTNSYFQDGFLTTNQIMINREIHLDYLDPPKTPKWDLSMTFMVKHTIPMWYLDGLGMVNCFDITSRAELGTNQKITHFVR